MSPSLTAPATQAALLEWADTMLLQEHPHRGYVDLRAKKLTQLLDGSVFNALLEILDDKYQPARFEKSIAAFSGDEDVYQGRRRNLHIIYVALKEFAQRSCPDVEPLINGPEFEDLVKEPTKTGTFQILFVFLCAACYCNDNERYINLVTNKLDPKYQQAIMNLLEEGPKLQQSDATTDDKDDQNDAAEDDDDALAYEAIIVQLQHEGDEARRQAGDLRLRLDRLTDSHDDLLKKHEELQEENEQLQKQIESEVGNFDKHRLQRQLKENEALIANLENERNFLIEERDRLLKEKARLETVAQKAETLADENQELRSRNEDLSKKANTADNLKKKVESLKHLEMEYNALQSERVDATSLMEQLQRATTRIETLKREAEAYATKMQGYEIDIADFNNQKTMYTSENTELRLRLEDLQNRSQIDEGVVRELQERIAMLDPLATSPSTPQGPRPVSLEDELNETSNAMTMRNLELQRLQAENAMLKSSIGTETEKGRLVQEMDDVRAERQALQDRYNDLLEKHTVGQHQLDMLIQNMGKDGDEAYSNLRTQVHAEQNNAKQLERQLAAAKEQLADKERALLEARGDLSAVEKSSLDALTELKRTDGMLAVSLRAELDAERKKHKALKEEFEIQRSQLLTAFIEKDELRREAEAANREMQRAADGQTISTESAKQSEKMEKLRARYKQLQQQYEQSELKNRELERTLKAVRAGSEAGAQKAQTDQIIKNLQRENAMIATAWYDLTSRLQSNHVVLQRRHDVPKSWLNKQRQMVNATPRK
ncbi:hypothetical protein M426DRAFT_320450 [Hypoxylon sp. CI-4A]|nr:hypothetical protein M426DRAFT_320450 [Hypoxylon sp. CI-4A]